MENQNDQTQMNQENTNPPILPLSTNNRSLLQSFIKNNYIVLVIIIAVVFLIIIFTIIFMNATISNNTTVAHSPTPSSNQTTYPSSSISEAPLISQAPTDSPKITEIKSQIKPQIVKLVAPGLDFDVTSIKTYGDSWATANINSSSAGGAAVIVQKNNGAWSVVLGPGSYFPSEDLNSINAPQDLINDMQSNQGTSDITGQ